MTKSALERAFLTQWKQLAPDYPEPEYNYKFHPDRKWELDFAWPKTCKASWRNGVVQDKSLVPSWKSVAVELHGGTWSGGRHVRGKGFRDDRTKMNAATAMGWRVFEVTGDMLSDDPVGCIQLIKEALDG